MNKNDLRKVILDIIKHIAPDEDLSNIDLYKPLREQIDLDSMDFLDIVMELRVRYGLDVPETDYQEFNTLAGIINYLFPKLQNI